MATEAERRAGRIRAARAAEPPKPARNRNPRYPTVRTSSRRSRDSFTPADRLLIFQLSAARHGGIARCALCDRELRLAGPAGLDRMIAGHIIARIDGGAAVLENGRAECSGCSWREGRRRLSEAATAARARKRIGAPAAAVREARPAEEEPAPWLLELLQRYRT